MQKWLNYKTGYEVRTQLKFKNENYAYRHIHIPETYRGLEEFKNDAKEFQNEWQGFIRDVPWANVAW